MCLAFLYTGVGRVFLLFCFLVNFTCFLKTLLEHATFAYDLQVASICNFQNAQIPYLILCRPHFYLRVQSNRKFILQLATSLDEQHIFLINKFEIFLEIMNSLRAWASHEAHMPAVKNFYKRWMGHNTLGKGSIVQFF